MIKQNEVLELFGNKENFIYVHLNPPAETGINQFE